MQVKPAGRTTCTSNLRPSLYASSSTTVFGGSILGALEPRRPKMKKTRLGLVIVIILGLGMTVLALSLRVADAPVQQQVGTDSGALAQPAKTGMPLMPTLLTAPAVIVVEADVDTSTATPATPTMPVIAFTAPTTFIATRKVLIAHTALLDAQTVKAAEPAGASLSASRPVAPEARQIDKDVVLIAALLKRISGQTDEDASDNKKTPLSLIQKTPRKNVQSRVLATSKFADSIQMQWQACSHLNFFEAEMCRLRTCTGRWGSHAVCPDYVQYSQATP